VCSCHRSSAIVIKAVRRRWSIGLVRRRSRGPALKVAVQRPDVIMSRKPQPLSVNLLRGELETTSHHVRCPAKYITHLVRGPS